MKPSPTPLDDLVDALHWGSRTPEAVVEASLSRIEAVDDDVRAFVRDTVERDRVAATATDLTERRSSPESRGPLFGVPVGVKDIVHVGGLPTRAGSSLPAETLAGPEATVVSRLRAAGAVVVGKTHTTEFAYFEPAPTRNPRALDRTPGGSSSGSAAAVAAGELPLALGTQTIGSVIRPAAFCGVVGFLPSYGRVPMDGVIPFSPSVDRVGTFAATLGGAERAAAVLVDGWEPVADPPESPTLGVPGEAYLSQADEVGREAFDRQVEALRGAGFTVVETDALDGIADVNGRHEQLTAAELALAHTSAGWYPRYAPDYSETTRELVEDGRACDVGTLAEGREGRGSLRQQLRATATSHGVDVWLSPAAPGPAPAGHDSTGDPVMNLPWTHAGLPTLTVPAGETERGLPLGLQLAGAHGGDEELLALGGLVADGLNAR